MRVYLVAESNESETARFSRAAVIDDLGGFDGKTARLHPLLKLDVR
jgi:hypothetical protein